MRKVLIYSLLLVAGLIASQWLHGRGEFAITSLTMIALSFIMIHVGYEFEIDRSNPRKYLWDYAIAGTAAGFPWLFCAFYFVFIMAPQGLWSSPDLWKESLLEARFSSPTSAGVLFSMLAAAGLGATWMFGKARVLAIFDDLDTILLMIPLKIMMVGFRWQLAIIIVVIFVLLWLAWKYLHEIRLPISWPFVLLYSVLIAGVSEVIYLLSRQIDSNVPIHLEVLLPAFVLGCMLARPKGTDPHVDDTREGVEEGPESPSEQRVSTIVSACFMVLVGLSMPPIMNGHDTAVASGSTALTPLPARASKAAPPAVQEAHPSVLHYEGYDPALVQKKHEFPGWGWIAFHVLAITLLSNIGKMVPAFVYRKEASFRERLALAIGMFPRGEVGAGVLVISLSYGLKGPAITVAALSLALNLLCTGFFILIIKRLLERKAEEPMPLRVTDVR